MGWITHLESWKDAVFSISKKLNVSKRSSQKGFFLAGWMSLLPFLLVLSFLSFSTAEGVKEYTKAFSLCRSSGALIQNHMKTQMRILMVLNIPATALRWTKNFYKAKLAAELLTGSPTAADSIKKIADIKKKQKKLSQKQKKIWDTGQKIFKMNLHKINFKFKKAGIYNVQFKNEYPMALKKKPSSSESPSYVPMEEFSQKQKLHIQWEMNLFRRLPGWIKNEFDLNKKQRFECSVSLEYLNKSFSIKLMKTS